MLPMTTEAVVARPTPSAPPVVRNPWVQLDSAMMVPNTAPFMIPSSIYAQIRKV